MGKNYFKRMKKSSVALLLGFAVLGGSVTAYAAAGDESFLTTLVEPNTDYALNTSTRTSYQKYYATMAYSRTDCAQATVLFRIKNNSNTIVSEGLYLTNRRDDWETIDYLDTYAATTGSMTLVARIASSHTGYYVAGMFFPNGK